MLKTTISLEAFLEKTHVLEDLLNSYEFGGYSEEQWEQKPLVDSIRKTNVHKLLRELRSYIADDAIDYTTAIDYNTLCTLLDTSGEDFYDFEEKLSEIFRRAENYIYEN